MIECFYNSDEDVQGDNELQEWVKDTHDNGFGHMKHPKPSLGFPVAIDTREQLVEFVLFIFFTTVRHTAVNFNNYEYEHEQH